MPLLPSPSVLHGLSGGQLATRLLRSLRCWLWWQEFYGDQGRFQEPSLALGYGQLRDRLFSPSHPRQETATPAMVERACQGSQCLCQVTTQQLLRRSGLPDPLADWVQGVAGLSGLTAAAVEGYLDQRPFAVVHRALRQDLQHLAQIGWLGQAAGGKVYPLPRDRWPSLPSAADRPGQGLAPADQQLLLTILEPLAFVHPQLPVVMDHLWQQVNDSPQPGNRPGLPQPRVFIHLDYILPEVVQEQVDQHQADIEKLWQSADGGVIQFDNWSPRQQQLRRVTVYPVCFHYARRAKYLSAYGLDPSGQLGWHNYRLDRIQSPRITVLPWGDPAVPEDLKHLRHTGQLPTPSTVDQALQEAWGFNFYLPRALLILRFPPAFARDYVQDTVRHPSFQPIPYPALPDRVRATVADRPSQEAILTLLAQRPPTDAYYQGWMRVGDINVTMRLRDWRPQAEVIAPSPVRQQMIAEAHQELKRYGPSSLQFRNQ